MLFDGNPHSIEVLVVFLILEHKATLAVFLFSFYFWDVAI